MPQDGLDTLKTFDAGLFGAVGAPGINPVFEGFTSKF
jgi:isocitrate/isopropylmalate dehydrogenase